MLYELLAFVTSSPCSTSLFHHHFLHYFSHPHNITFSCYFFFVSYFPQYYFPPLLLLLLLIITFSFFTLFIYISIPHSHSSVNTLQQRVLYIYRNTLLHLSKYLFSLIKHNTFCTQSPHQSLLPYSSSLKITIQPL